MVVSSKQILAFFVVWHSLYAAWGFTPENQIEISLDQLIEKTRQNHPENIIYQHQIQSVQSMKLGAVTLPNPMLAFEEMMNPMTGMTKEYRWEFRQKIPFPSRIFLSSDFFDREVESLRYQQREAQIRRELSVRTEYFRWLSLYNKLRLKKEQETLLGQLIAVQHTRYVAQKVSQVELVALQIERGNLLNEISSIEFEIVNQGAALEILVGPNLELKGGLRQFKPAPVKDAVKSLVVEEEGVLKLKARTENQQIKAMEQMVERDSVAVARARQSWLPDLEIMLARQTSDHGVQRSSWQIGLEIPLWFGREQRGMIHQSKAVALESQTRLSEEKRKIGLTLEALLAERKQLRNQLDLMEGGLVQWSTQNVRSARTAYQTGKLEYASFVTLFQSAYQTLSSYEDLKVKIFENHQQIQALVGGPS